MGQIGRYTYPDIGPIEAVNITRTIQNQFDGVIEQEDRGNLADVLGHESADSGAFKQKLSSLKKYDLLEGRGTLRTTESAERIGRSDSGAFLGMLESVDLLHTLYNHFDGELPEQPEWESFIESYSGVDEGVEEIQGSEKLRSVYGEFTQVLPDEEEYLDKESKFDYYVDKLEDKNTRKAALDAIKRNLRRKNIGDPEIVDTVLEYVRREEYPGELDKLYGILLNICKYNDIERLESGKEREVVNLLFTKLAEYSSEGMIEETDIYRHRILDTIEVLNPDDAVDELWDLLIQKLKKSSEINHTEMRDFAVKEIANRLMRADTQISSEFFEEKAAEAEDELWDIMAEADEEDLRRDCERLLSKMDVL